MSHAGHPPGPGTGYEVVDSTVTHEGQLSTIRVDTVRMPDGATAQREIVEHSDAVAVVALTPEGELVLLRQYRHPFADSFLELPAGKLDVDGESPEAAASRELLEETGLAADELTALVRFSNSAGWSDESTTVYLAVGVRERTRPEGFVAEHEEAHMDVLRVPFAEALQRAEAGEISDAKTLIGILLAARHL